MAEIRAGYPFRGAIPAIPGGPVGVIQMKDVSLGGVVDWSHVVRTELPGKKAPDYLRPGDLLFAAKGTRFYAVVLNEVPFKAVASPHFFHLRLRNERIALPGFVAWLLNAPNAQRLFEKAAEGSSQLSLRKSVLENFTAAWPSLATQRTISEMITTARAERAVLQRLIETRRLQLDAVAVGIDCHLAEATQNND